MLAIRKQPGRYEPVIVCDECGAVIDDAFGAIVVSSHAPEGTTAQPFHVHKGACDAAMSQRIAGLSGSEELAVHLIDLLKHALSRSDPAGVRMLLEAAELT